MRTTQDRPLYPSPKTHTHTHTHTRACTCTHRHAYALPRICPSPLTATRPLDAQAQVPSITPDSPILFIHPLANTLAPSSKHVQHPTTAKHLPVVQPHHLCVVPITAPERSPGFHPPHGLLPTQHPKSPFQNLSQIMLPLQLKASQDLPVSLRHVK